MFVLILFFGLVAGSVVASEQAPYFAPREQALVEFFKGLPAAQLEKLSIKNSGIAFGHLNSDEPDYWGVYRIGADLINEEFETFGGGKPVVVGVLDEGFNLSHRLFEHRIRTQRIPGQAVGNTTHGTHVLGTLSVAQPFSVARNCPVNFALASFRNKQLAKFFPMHGMMANIVDSINYQPEMLREIEALGSVPDIRVISASLRFGNESSFGSEVSKLLQGRELLYVNAAGNEHENLANRLKNQPIDDKILFVASVGPRGTPSEFSNYGDAVFISAPGEKIFSLQSTTSFQRMFNSTIAPTISSGAFEEKLLEMSGTSMATPHVSGTIAWINYVAPALRPLEVRKILQQTAVNWGYQKRGFGHGVLNTYGATKLAEQLTHLSWAQALETLKSESRWDAERGMDLLAQLTSDPSPKISEQALRWLRKAYFLDPGNLERQRQLYLAERWLGFRGEAEALGAQIYNLSKMSEYLYDMNPGGIPLFFTFGF